jgi:class 3 adenylate cyclase/tetratricopeptide (TPR) repeat protein
VTIDIQRWLELLGLERYAGLFIEHEIDLDAARELTEDDLRELEIAMGPRKKLLRAIAELSEGPASLLSEPPSIVAEQAEFVAEPKTSYSEAERRQLTVMFCDLVGSTELSRRLDPEDLRDVTRRYQDAVSGAVTRYGGHIAKFLGDGVLAYFGWPTAYEDQSERAVRSGLEAVLTVAKLQLADGSALAARVGIATGQVVVGDLIGEVGRDAEAVSGETPNLAARLQGLGAPGQVVVGAVTKELVGHQFSLESLGEHELKGFGIPVPAWLVADEIKSESRFAAAHSQGLRRFVGRQSELNILQDRWELAKSGEGQVVLLSGEAGIGKSRITQMLSDHIRQDENFHLQYQCSPHHVNSPLYPAIRQLEFAAGLASADSTDEKLDKLESLLEQSRTTELAPLMAALLALPADDRYPLLGLTPLEQKQQTLEALVKIFEGLSAKRPVFFVFEDAHWIDPTTREQMDLLVDRTAALPALILVTHRPEFEAAWPAYAHSTVLSLNRLGREACADLISDVTGGMTLPQEVFEQIVSKTDGVPLFVEELTKTVLESGLLVQKGDHFALSGPLPPLAIPSTLQDSLMARLDRLEALKEIAQIGSAIGREFAHTLLETIAPLSGSGLEDALDHLTEAEIIFRRGVGAEASYIFKHALIQDTAYESMLKSRRQQIHANIANALLTRFQAQVQNEPEVLASHYTRAGLLQEAAPYWLLAGQRAIARSANSEAIAHLIDGLGILDQLGDAENVSNLELDMQIGLGSARIASRGYSAEETEQAWLRARKLLDSVGEDSRQFAVLHGLCMVYWNRAQLEQMNEVNEDMLQRAGRQNDALPKLVATRVMAVGLNPMGRFEEARKYAQLATDLYDPEAHSDSAHRFGHDQGVGAYWHLAIAQLFLGYPDASLAAGARASSLTASLQNANTNSYNSLWAAFTCLVRRDWEGASKIAEPMIEDALSRSMALWVAFGRHLLGSALVNLDQPEAGMKQLHLGREEAQSLNNCIFLPMTLRFEAQALALLGRHDDAVRCLDKALEHIEATVERWWEPDVHRTRGEILRRINGDASVSEASLRQAMVAATSQEARLSELRSACSLGHFLRDHGRADEARDVLTPVYRWFAEGFDTPDLLDANALLNELT